VIAFDSNKFKVTELPPNHLQMEFTPAEKLLKEVNLSLTRQRVAVLELFLKEEHPMTPHEVREILEDQEHVDQVTIYRVLEALVRTRLLTQVPSTDRNSYYCLAERLQGLHAHLYCNLCRRMLCVESPLAAQTERSEELHVVLSGTCTQCDQAVPDTNI
jgi:Fe2+ or Zn2+ uptake regulation protein